MAVARLRPAFALLGLCALCGCAQTVRDATRSAAPAAVSGSLEGLHEPQNRQRIAEVLSDPEIRTASGELARAISAGALDGLSDVERDQRVALATDVFVDHLGGALARSLRTQIGPEISNIVARSVNESLAAVFSEQNQRRARDFANGLAPTPPADNGGDATEPQNATPAGLLARNLAREAALGVQDAVRQSVRKQDVGKKQSGDILAVAGKSADQGGRLLRTLAIAAGVFALAALIAIVWAILRARRYRREGAANEQAALLVARALEQAEGSPWATEAAQHLQRLLRKPPPPRRERSDTHGGGPVHVGE